MENADRLENQRRRQAALDDKRLPADLYHWKRCRQISNTQIAEVLDFMTRPECGYPYQAITQGLLSKPIQIREARPVFTKADERERQHAFLAEKFRAFSQRFVWYGFALGFVPYSWVLHPRWGAYPHVLAVESMDVWMLENDAGEIAIKMFSRETGPFNGNYTGTYGVYYGGGGDRSTGSLPPSHRENKPMSSIPASALCAHIAQRLPECYVALVDPPRMMANGAYVQLASRAASLLEHAWRVDRARNCARRAWDLRSDPVLYISKNPSQAPNMVDVANAAAQAKLGNCPTPNPAAGPPRGFRAEQEFEMVSSAFGINRNDRSDVGLSLNSGRSEYDIIAGRMTNLIADARRNGTYGELRSRVEGAGSTGAALQGPGLRFLPAGYKPETGPPPAEGPANLQEIEDAFQELVCIVWQFPRMLVNHASTTHKSKAAAAGPNDPAARFLRTALHFWATCLSTVLVHAYGAMYHDHYALLHSAKTLAGETKRAESKASFDASMANLMHIKASAAQELDYEYTTCMIEHERVVRAAAVAEDKVRASEQHIAALRARREQYEMELRVAKGARSAAVLAGCYNDDIGDYDNERMPGPTRAHRRKTKGKSKRAKSKRAKKRPHTKKKNKAGSVAKARRPATRSRTQLATAAEEEDEEEKEDEEEDDSVDDSDADSGDEDAAATTEEESLSALEASETKAAAARYANEVESLTRQILHGKELIAAATKSMEMEAAELKTARADVAKSEAFWSSFGAATTTGSASASTAAYPPGSYGRFCKLVDDRVARAAVPSLATAWTLEKKQTSTPLNAPYLAEGNTVVIKASEVTREAATVAAASKRKRRQSDDDDEESSGDEADDEAGGDPWDAAFVPKVLVTFPAMIPFRDVDELCARGWLRPDAFPKYAAAEYGIPVEEMHTPPKPLPVDPSQVPGTAKSTPGKAEKKKKTKKAGDKDTEKERVAEGRSNNEEEGPKKKRKTAPSTEMDSEQKSRNNDGIGNTSRDTENTSTREDDKPARKRAAEKKKAKTTAAAVPGSDSDSASDNDDDDE